MAGPYSEHRRPTAVPAVKKPQRFDTTGEEDLKVQNLYQQAMERAGAKPANKRTFAELIKNPKK
jgi:hypothetical protein